MNSYEFDNAKDISIKTPIVENMFEVKLEVLEQTPRFQHTRQTFPDGLVMEMKQWADKVELKTNREIRTLPDGSLSLRIE